MEPKFQTSFIPKKPISSDSDKVERVYETNIFSLSAKIIFTVTILLYGGLYFYNTYLVKQIVSADLALNEARTAIEPEKIQEILNNNSRIIASMGLLERHLATTELLTFLSDNSVKNLKFNDLIYVNKGGSPTILINGEVISYNALAFQNNLFLDNDSIKNVKFSDVNLGEEGSIRFKMNADINPKIVSYKKMIESMGSEI